MIFKTEQEEFLAGGFGDDYIARNQGEELLASTLSIWVHMLKDTKKLHKCIDGVS